jgi:hypothetical protein
MHGSGTCWIVPAAACSPLVWQLNRQTVRAAARRAIGSGRAKPFPGREDRLCGPVLRRVRRYLSGSVTCAALRVRPVLGDYCLVAKRPEGSRLLCGVFDPASYHIGMA